MDNPGVMAGHSETATFSIIGNRRITSQQQDAMFDYHAVTNERRNGAQHMRSQRK
jgi:hypothetical protein